MMIVDDNKKLLYAVSLVMRLIKIPKAKQTCVEMASDSSLTVFPEYTKTRQRELD